MKLTDNEQFVIAEALRVARARYEEDAVECRKGAAELKADDNPGGAAGYERLARQFDTQVAQCTALLNNQFVDAL